ncbi:MULTISPECIES: hypothetical protein [Actinosynnema]|uniref:hypothetical protein n=1 Tax=Actinosynnema TaxID=40566 RepID=UPI0020A4A179|nr:hypothetical protein [Actinosynnema pretiosum]MCP2097445.1 hypothetical protein [Actinosynnema pretiosum]
MRGQDCRGKEVTCQRLDEVHDLWLAAYGGTGPTADLDVATQARHHTDLRTAVEALFAALDPMRGDLTQLDQRLTGEVVKALAHAELAAAEAEQARRETRKANAAREQALKDKKAADEAAAYASRGRGAAPVERDEAKAAARTAATREADRRKRADDLSTLLQEATKTNADQVGVIGEFTGAKNQLIAQVDRMGEKITELEGQRERERATATEQAEKAATAAQKKLDDLCEAHTLALEAQHRQFAGEHKAAERELAGTIVELSTELATAKADAEHNWRAAVEVRRLRERLLASLAANGPDGDLAQLRDRVTAALGEPDADDEPITSER